MEIELDNPYLDLTIEPSPKGRLFKGYNKCLALGFDILADELVSGKSICSIDFIPIKYCPFCGRKL